MEAAVMVQVTEVVPAVAMAKVGVERAVAARVAAARVAAAKVVRLVGLVALVLVGSEVSLAARLVA